MPAYMTAAQFAALDPVILDAYATVQAFHNPAPITLRRGVSSGTPVNVVTFTPIEIDREQRVERVGGQNTGLVEIANEGRFRAFTPLDVERDDRFVWNGQHCMVTVVEAPSHGTQVVHFTIRGGA